MALTRQGQILTSTQIATMRLNLANPIVAPAAPYNVIASAINGGANLQWSHPQPSVVDTYIVTASPGGASVTVSGQSATLTGLTNGTAYTFTVQAENAGGTGLASASSNSVTPSALPSSILPVTRGLEAWWSARNTPSPPSDGAGMATWADLSGNGYYLTGRGSSGALPTWKASWSNSKPAVQSNGIDARFDTVGSGLVAGLRAPQATIYALQRGLVHLD